MNEAMIAEIIATILALVVTVLGVKYQKIKVFVSSIVAAAADDKITAEEVQNIILDFKALFYDKK